MWMACVKEVKITDFKYSIENRYREFSNLAFGAHHEAIYGMGAFLSMVKCTELGDRYDVARNACDDLLESKIGRIK